VAAEIEAECPPKKAKTKETELNVTDSVPKVFTSNEGKLNMIMKSNDDLQKQVTSLNETIAAMQNQPSNNRNNSYSGNNRFNQHSSGHNYRGRPPVKCFICGKEGHKYMNCRGATWE
jgi:hypothetical protein